MDKTLRKAEVDREPDRTGTILGLSTSGFHSVAYTDDGPTNTRVPIVCVHGLTRQGRDFDYLAAHLAAAGRRVVCPDLVGRGQSGKLLNPNEYALPQYCADINALIAALGTKEVTERSRRRGSYCRGAPCPGKPELGALLLSGSRHPPASDGSQV